MVRTAFWAGMLSLPLLCGGLFGWFAPQRDDLTILDVGQGDCAVLRHAGATILIDDGPAKRTDPRGPPAVMSALRRIGVDDVDLILLSHPDADHVGGTGALLRQFPHVTVAISGYYASQPKLLRDLREWGLKPEAVLWLPQMCRLRVSGSTLTIVCPPVSDAQNDNLGSMCVRWQDEGATADFTGDAPSEVENQLVGAGNWRADILHVGHHGSRHSTGLEWIRAVHPQVAVISCGRDNPYGHPHRATLDRLAASHVPVLRTDQQGDLVFVPISGHFQHR